MVLLGGLNLAADHRNVGAATTDRQRPTGYAALTTLFDEWLAFERPAVVSIARMKWLLR